MLVERLLQNGYDVGVLLRKSADPKLLNKHLLKLNLLEFDGSFNSMANWFSVYRPIAVIHLASLFLASHEPDNIPDLIASNLQLGTQLAEACVKYNCNNFINTGTSWQSFEEDEVDSVNLYASTKDAFEKILKYYSQAHGLKVITLRLFDTYGPCDPRPKIIQLLIKQVKLSKSLDLSPGDQRLNLVHIEDVVNAFVMAVNWISIQESSTNIFFGVFDDVDYSIREIVLIIEKITSLKMSVNFGALPYRNREVMFPVKGYFRLPGWRATRTLEQGLSELI